MRIVEWMKHEKRNPDTNNKFNGKEISKEPIEDFRSSVVAGKMAKDYHNCLCFCSDRILFLVL